MMLTANSRELAGLNQQRVSISPEELRALENQLDGPVLQEGDEGWDAAISIWNAMVARTPALVIQPSSARDVAIAVSFASEHDLLISVKGGGHNIAGTSMAPGGLTLDMSRLRGVEVDPDAMLAHVGAGSRLHDVDLATQQHGLATVLGFVSKVGVAGLTLGGGFGYLSRRFGWSVDNLEEVEIVTADGEIRIASRDRHSDLFWALRGGGGNFGVVTRFTYRLHRVGPNITGGLILWSAEQIDEVLAAYLELQRTAPPELTAALIVRTAPPAPFIPPQWHGAPIVGMLICHSGTHAASDLAGIRGLAARPIADLISEMPYVAQQSLLDTLDPDGLEQYWKAEYLPELSSDYLSTFARAALKTTFPLSFSVVFPIGGALNDRATDEGAVGNRDARYISGFSGAWPPSNARESHIAWVRESWESIRQFSTGGNYVNFQLADDDEERTATAYASNLARLKAVKSRYDSKNLFRVNRNIVPSPPI